MHSLCQLNSPFLLKNNFLLIEESATEFDMPLIQPIILNNPENIIKYVDMADLVLNYMFYFY